MTQKPSCRVQSLQHKHTQAVIAHRSFVGVSRLQINKDESITAREARTQDSHHDELATREGFRVLFLSFKVHANYRVGFRSVEVHRSPTACHERCLALDAKVTEWPLPSGCPPSSGESRVIARPWPPRQSVQGAPPDPGSPSGRLSRGHELFTSHVIENETSVI